jgi:hypothetical protein
MSRVFDEISMAIEVARASRAFSRSSLTVESGLVITCVAVRSLAVLAGNALMVDIVL